MISQETTLGKPLRICQKGAYALPGDSVGPSRHITGHHSSVEPVLCRSELPIAPRGVINRYYDPATGQFVSVDPLVGLTGAAYSYVGGDPIDGVDPLGLLCLELHCITNDFEQFGHIIKKHWKGIAEAVGTVVGVLSLFVGVGEIGLLGAGLAASLDAWTTVGILAGFLGAATDYDLCRYGSEATACISAGLGVFGGVLGIAGKVLAGSVTELGQLLSLLANESSVYEGTSSSTLDVLSALAPLGEAGQKVILGQSIGALVAFDAGRALRVLSLLLPRTHFYEVQSS